MKLRDEKLEIEWKDGHKSEYSIDWLKSFPPSLPSSDLFVYFSYLINIYYN